MQKCFPCYCSLANNFKANYIALCRSLSMYFIGRPGVKVEIKIKMEKRVQSMIGIKIKILLLLIGVLLAL